MKISVSFFLLLFISTVNQAQDPFSFEEGSIRVSIYSNAKAPSTNKHVTLNFKGKEKPQITLVFENLKWKKNNNNKIYQLFADPDWITIKGDNHALKKSQSSKSKAIKLSVSGKRKINFYAIDNGKVHLEIPLLVIKSKGKEKRSRYTIKKVIYIRGINKGDTVKEEELVLDENEQELPPPPDFNDDEVDEEPEITKEKETEKAANVTSEKPSKPSIQKTKGRSNKHPKPTIPIRKKPIPKKPKTPEIDVQIGEEITVIESKPIDSTNVEEKLHVDIENDKSDIEIKLFGGLPPYYIVIEDNLGNVRYKEKMNANCPCVKTIYPEILLLSAGNYQIKVSDAKKNLSFEKNLTINYLTSFNAQASVLKSHLIFMICSLAILVLIVVFLFVNSKTMLPVTRVLSFYYKVKSYFFNTPVSGMENEQSIRILNIPQEESSSQSLKPNKLT